MKRKNSVFNNFGPETKYSSAKKKISSDFLTTQTEFVKEFLQEDVDNYQVDNYKRDRSSHRDWNKEKNKT